jgi:hypothetical protein
VKAASLERRLQLRKREELLWRAHAGARRLGAPARLGAGYLTPSVTFVLCVVPPELPLIVSV